MQRRFITEDREVSAKEVELRLERERDHAWATFLEARQDHDDAMKAYVAHLRNPKPSVEKVLVAVLPGDPRYDSAPYGDAVVWSGHELPIKES